VVREDDVVRAGVCGILMGCVVRGSERFDGGVVGGSERFDDGESGTEVGITNTE
jgi:hypothetical protein